MTPDCSCPAAGAAPGATRGKLDRNGVEARPVVGGADDVVTAVRKQPERPLVAGAVTCPALDIDRHAGTGAEGLAELVLQVGRDAADADQPLVDIGDAIGERRRQGGEQSKRRAERDSSVEMFMDIPL